MIRVDIICPVYREEATILNFHMELLKATGSLSADISFRYIYVVDPANDRSEEVLRDLAERDASISVLVMSRRFGHQIALIAGLDASSGDAVVMLDSDLQHPPSLIPELICQWQSGADIVQALRLDHKKRWLGRRLTSSLFYGILERFTDIKIRSGAADFRLLSRTVVDVLCHQLREHNPFLRGLVTWVGYKIVYVPFTPAQRAGGRSNYSLATLLVFAMNGVCSFSKLPLRLCVWFGLTFALLSVIGGLLNIGVYLFIDDNYAPGWASLFAFLTLAVSVNLFFLGVLGEYVGLIFDEVKGRPRYLVSRIYGEKPSVAAIAVPHQEQQAP